jgi:tetratricopeptide (TPR) repeat protein
MINKTFAIGLILIIVFTSFLPSLHNDFVNWDDVEFVMNNSLIKELSWENLGRIFTSSHDVLYKPVVFLVFALEYHFFKLNPFFYHLINLIFHLANSLLVFWLIFLITDKTGVAFITALLFGVHPLRVESVAWVFELKDLLCGFFFLWALVLYLYYRKSNFLRYYYLALFSFVLSLLSKPLGLALPFVLLAVEYLKNYRLKYWDKVPFLFLSVGIVIINIVGNKFGVSSEWRSLRSFWLIPCQISFYLNKVFLPVKLSCLYPEDVLQPPYVFFSTALLFLLAVAALFSQKYTRKLVFGSLFFLLLLAPTLFSHAYYQVPYIVADHFTYLALIGIFYILSEGFFWFYRKQAASSPLIRIFLILIPCTILGILSFLTYQRTKVWKDSLNLWNDVLKNYSNVATAYINRGLFFTARKEYDLAAFDFRKALALEPGALEPYINLCVLYIEKEEYSRAISLCNQLIDSIPQDPKLYVNLGMAYNGLGKTQEAIAALTQAQSLNPDYLDVYYGLAGVYLKQGDIVKAVGSYEQAIAKDPYNIETYNRLIAVQAKAGNHRQVIKLSERLLQLDARSAQAYCNLGSAYGFLGDFPASIRYSLQALKLDEKLTLAHMNLAVAYYYTQQYRLALKHCDRAIQLGATVEPDFLKLLKTFR